MTDRGGAAHPLVELTLARLREFVREPEAVFWVFAFPLLLALALGIAFRVQGRRPGARRRRRRPRAPADARGCPRAGRRPRGRGSCPGAARTPRCATARWRSWSCPDEPPAYPFRSDARREPAGPAGRRRGPAARRRPRGPVRRAGGPRHGAGFALHRLARPGPARHEHHGHEPVEHRLRDRPVADRGSCSSGWSPRRCAAATTCCRYLLARLVFLVLEVAPLAGVRMARLRRARARLARGARSRSRCSGPRRSAAIGLLVASRARTVEAVSGLMNLVSCRCGSCRACSSRRRTFPAAMQPFIRALPLTALNDALRAVMLDGDSLLARGPPPGGAGRVGRRELRRRAQSLPVAVAGRSGCGIRVIGRRPAQCTPEPIWSIDGSAPSRRMAVSHSTAASVSNTRSSSSSPISHADWVSSASSCPGPQPA